MATVYVQDVSKLPTRKEHDHYPTAPVDVCRGLDFLWDTIACHTPFKEYPSSQWAPTVLDPGAGDGVWCRVLREDGYCCPSVVVGVEIRPTPRPQAYDRWHVADFLELATNYEPACEAQGYGLVIGNPPYAAAEQWVRASLKLLAPNGYLLFLLRLTFLESQKRGDGLFVEHPPLRIGFCKRRPSFLGNGKTSPDAYCYIIWRKGFRGEGTHVWV